MNKEDILAKLPEDARNLVGIQERKNFWILEHPYIEDKELYHKIVQAIKEMGGGEGHVYSGAMRYEIPKVKSGVTPDVVKDDKSKPPELETKKSLTESEKHYTLKKVAKQLLLEKGFKEKEIHDEYVYGHYKIDVVALSKDKRVAIECGDTNKAKLMELFFEFDEVYHLPYPDKEPIQIEIGDLKRKIHHLARFGVTFLERVRDIYKMSKVEFYRDVLPMVLEDSDILSLNETKDIFKTDVELVNVYDPKEKRGSLVKKEEVNEKGRVEKWKKSR